MEIVQKPVPGLPKLDLYVKKLSSDLTQWQPDLTKLQIEVQQSGLHLPKLYLSVRKSGLVAGKWGFYAKKNR